MNLDNDLVQKMHDLWKDARGDDRREHLGASVIGRECDREIWYGFRWAKTGAFDGRMLRLFDRGKREEIVVLFELASCGIKIRNEDGVQERFSDHGGHFCGSPDAIGVKDGRAFVVEIKTANDKSWNDLHKNGVAESKPEHFCQMQVYMGEMKIPKALYISVNKNTDEIHAEWVEFDKDAYNALRQRARELIFSAMPPERMSDNPANFKCKFCGMWPICHGGEPVEKNCRTCTFSVPLEEGGWRCVKRKIDLDRVAQIAGCEDWKNVAEVPF